MIEERREYEVSMKKEIGQLKEQNMDQIDEYRRAIEQCQREIEAEKMKHSNELNGCQQEVAQFPRNFTLNKLQS